MDTLAIPERCCVIGVHVSQRWNDIKLGRSVQIRKFATLWKHAHEIYRKIDDAANPHIREYLISTREPNT